MTIQSSFLAGAGVVAAVAGLATHPASTSIGAVVAVPRTALTLYGAAQCRSPPAQCNYLLQSRSTSPHSPKSVCPAYTALAQSPVLSNFKLYVPNTSGPFTSTETTLVLPGGGTLYISV